jgi:oligopeptide transport system substrate-binding protein
MFFLCALFAVAAACGGAGEPAGPPDTLQRGLLTDPETLDQHRSRSIQAADVIRDLGEGLVSYSATGELIPGAAEKWEVSADGLKYTFQLRDGLRWSNGDVLTADDFVAGMRRLVDPSTAAFYANMLESIENAAGIVSGDIPVSMLGVDAPDDRTLVLRLAQQTPYLISLLTHPSTFPIHRESLAEHGDGFARPGRLVSNGAYKLEAWVPGSLISLKRNEHYWNNAATAIDAVNYHVIVQDNSELNRYRAGELHMTSTVPPDSFAQIREEYGDQLRVAPYLGVYYYGFNLTKPPFKDNRALRQALSMAVDRQLLAEKVVGRGEEPAFSWVPPGVNNYEPPRSSFAALSKSEREQVARRLYKEAGYTEDKPLRVEVRYNTNDTNKKIAVAIQSMWLEVLGVEATLINEEAQVWLANMKEAEVTQVFRASWMGDYNDAHTFLSVLQGGGAANMTRYANPDYDALMARAAEQTDPNQRKLLLEEAERVMLADYPVIPMYFFVSKHLVSPEIAGWGDNVLDYHYSQHLSFKAAQ